jgi:ketosteroid isomerase-like protein
VSRRNLEALERVYERWGQGDFRAGLGLFDARVMFVMGPGFPDSGIYVGHEGVSEYMRGFLEPWSHITIVALEMTPVGDTVVAEVRQRGTGDASGADTGFDYFQLWTFRGEKVIRFETFRERSEAFAAAGLEPG